MEFSVLGPLEALDGGARSSSELRGMVQLSCSCWSTRTRRAQRSPCRGLWPDGPPKTAAKAIQVYVFALRKPFGSSRDALETCGPGYVLEVLGLTESRVSQLHTKAILRLQAHLSGAQ